MNRPNILFFFTDDQRFDTIAALGNPEISTPNLDNLAASGVAFTHAHIPGGTCGAVCMPSRAMLHSGRTLFHIRGEGQEIPPEHETMGQAFQNAGYTSFGIGKWHNGRQSFARSFNRGDEIFFGGMGDHWNVPAYRFDPSGKYEAKTPFVPDPFLSNFLKHRDCDHVTAGRHSTDLFADAAVEFLKTGDASRPFFLYVSLMAPHDPRTMPEKFLRMYDPEKIALPPSFQPEHQIDTGALRIRDEMLAAFPRDPVEIRRHIAEYYAMITHLDDAFGRVMRAVDDAGERENTIVVFAGDNGLALGRHGLMGKQNLYEHSVRVPLFFSGPGIPSGRISRAFVYLLDVFPTLCDLAGLPIPASVEGQSMASCIRDPGAPMRDSLYLAYGSSIRGVKNNRHKLVEYACGASQLFDLKQDPFETGNLAETRACAPALAQLRAELADKAGKWDDEKHPAGAEFWRRRLDLK